MSFREIDVQHQDVTSGNNHATARLSCLMQLYAKFHKPVKQFLELIVFFGGMKTREGKEGLTETCIKKYSPKVRIYLSPKPTARCNSVHLLLKGNRRKSLQPGADLLSICWWQIQVDHWHDQFHSIGYIKVQQEVLLFSCFKLME